jgi:hypothetical protein
MLHEALLLRLAPVSDGGRGGGGGGVVMSRLAAETAWDLDRPAISAGTTTTKPRLGRSRLNALSESLGKAGTPVLRLWARASDGSPRCRVMQRGAWSRRLIGRGAAGDVLVLHFSQSCRPDVLLHGGISSPPIWSFYIDAVYLSISSRHPSPDCDLTGLDRPCASAPATAIDKPVAPANAHVAAAQAKQDSSAWLPSGNA